MMARKKHPERGANSRQQQCQERTNDVDNGKRTAKALVKRHPEEENPKYEQAEANGSRNIPQSLNMMKNL
jgi:hypothetical protein